MDNLPAEYRDGCRAELIALNASRDSVQKIETRFREDVIRLAESFAKMELNGERLRMAKAMYSQGLKSITLPNRGFQFDDNGIHVSKVLM